MAYSAIAVIVPGYLNFAVCFIF